MNKNNVIVATAYLGIIGFIISFFVTKSNGFNPFSKFHLRQALGINILFLLIGFVVTNFDHWMMMSSFFLFFFILWIFGFSSALTGKMIEIPLVGSLFQKLFKFL